MELFTRLINEGFFAYWNDDKNGDSYVVKLYILNADKKSELFSEEISGNRHCFSADKLGSGEYQIEVSSFIQGQIIDTVSKKVNLLSTAQKLTEAKDAIDGIKDAIEKTNSIGYYLSTILDALRDPERYCDEESWAVFIKKINRVI